MYSSWIVNIYIIDTNAMANCLVGYVKHMSLTCHEMSVLLGNFEKNVSLLIGEMCMWGVPEDDLEKIASFYFLVHF